MSRHRLALTNPDNPSGTTAPTEHHVVKRLLAAVLTAACMLDASATNVAPTVAMTAPAANAAFVAPAAITLSANATDSDGTIQKVEFYSGATLLATDTEAPFSFVWTNVAAGTYQLTAKATDDANEATTSAVQSVTVAAPAGSAAPNVFFIFSDQINTAHEITNGAQVKVWQAEPEPFGANLPDENPAGQGVFPYNQRFPGQYFDKETGLHYNYFRDYDPQTGRYVQSDPIGLEGGINTYGYAGGNPLSNVDPTGEFFFAIPAIYWAGGAVAAGGAIWWSSTHQPQQASQYGRDVYMAMVQDANHAAQTAAQPVPYPERKKGKWTCTCRVMASGRCRDNRTNDGQEYAMGTGVGSSIGEAKRAAEKAAKDILGAKSTHHVQCRCISPTGERKIPHG